MTLKSMTRRRWFGSALVLAMVSLAGCQEPAGSTLQWSASDHDTSPDHRVAFHGPFSNQTVSVSADGLGAHDFLLIDAEDGCMDAVDPDALPDERLALIFTCCHPALAREAQVALTLRLVVGLTTAEIARLFLVAEATMAARLTRAKRKIAAARIPFREPEPAERAERRDGVLAVVYLLFTEGYAGTAGEALH